MNNASLDKYLEDRGITVIWNTLGHSEELMQAYVSDTHAIVDSSPTKRSHFSKKACYDLFYPMETRDKRTGFEEFDARASELKTELCAAIPQGGSPSVLVDTHEQPVAGGYKEVLKTYLRELSGEKYLYLSGGIDSELVAQALVDAEISFTPVVFNWVNNAGEDKNSYETNYAYDFCRKHHLHPITRTVNIEALWSTPEFRKLAEDVQLISAHLITHVYMVEMIAEEFPGKTHLFGGEVRYTSNFVKDDGSLSNLVLLAKTTPGYNGNTYHKAANNTVSGLTLYYKTATYGWSVTGNGTGTISGTPTLGTWDDGTSPAAGYEYRIVSVTDEGFSSGSSTPDIGASFPTAWATINSTNTALCRVNALSQEMADFLFIVEVRGTSDLITKQTQIQLYANVLN